MISIKTAANQLSITIDEIRMMLMDVRTDWADCKEITEAEYQIIDNAVQAKSSGGSAIAPAPVEQISFESQEQLVNNASQVLNYPLMLSVAQELKNLDSLHEVKNAIALNIIQKRQAELNAVIREQSEARQRAYETAIEDLAAQMQKPVSVAEEMVADIKAGNERLDAILAQVRAGK